MFNRFFEYARLIRLPALGGLSIGPIFGGLAQLHAGAGINLQILILLLLIGIFKSIYGFVLNDYADIDLDKLSDEADKRPLASGKISKKVALLICLICILLTFSIVFLFFYRKSTFFYYGILTIIIAAILGSIYNLYGKKFASSSFIAAIADALFVLVGAFLVTNTEIISIFTWVIFLLYFTQILFMNAVIGGIKDAGHDYLLKVKNVALALGVKVTKDKKVFMPLGFKIFGIVTRFSSAILVFIPFIFYDLDYELLTLILLALVVIIVLYYTVKLLSIKKIELQKDEKTIRLFGIQGVIRYTFVPILLIPVIKPINSFILIIFPILWYMIFMPLSGKKPFKKLM